MTTALIMAPAGPRGARWRDECFAYCERQGYEVVGVVAADADGWRSAMDAQLAGDVDVLVIARWDHRPAERIPRVESVSDAEPFRRRPGSRRGRCKDGMRPG